MSPADWCVGLVISLLALMRSTTEIRRNQPLNMVESRVVTPVETSFECLAAPKTASKSAAETDNRSFAFNCFRSELYRIFADPPLQKSFWFPIGTG